MAFPRVDTKDSAAVQAEVNEAYFAMYADAESSFVGKAFDALRDCFAGRYKDYQPIDAAYHDLEHTMQGTLCMVRLLRGRHQAEAKPAVGRRLFELGIYAILLHDTGYLKRRADQQGTGAKYTLTHVTRSVLLAEDLLTDRGLPIGEIRSVQNQIRCTGVNVDLSRIPFQSETEKIVGFALGTGDLLGQMSAADYVEKLPTLYDEFDESARFYEGRMVIPQRFASADELMRRTSAFWNGYVRPKIENDFWGLYKFLNQPYPNGRNEYIDRIELNVERLEKRLRDETVNG